MGDNAKFITGLLAGLGLAFVLDPDRGARRRALLRDKAALTGRRLAEGVEAKARHLRNRAQGAAAEVRSRFQPDEAEDEVLHERVRGGTAVVNELEVRPDDEVAASLQGHESRSTGP